MAILWDSCHVLSERKPYTQSGQEPRGPLPLSGLRHLFASWALEAAPFLLQKHEQEPWSPLTGVHARYLFSAN